MIAVMLNKHSLQFRNHELRLKSSHKLNSSCYFRPFDTPQLEEPGHRKSVMIKIPGEGPLKPEIVVEQCTHHIGKRVFSIILKFSSVLRK